MKEYIVKVVLTTLALSIVAVACCGLVEHVRGNTLVNHDIVYCGTDWCSGCVVMKPIIKKLDKNYDVYYAKQSEFAKYGVTALPTTLVYRRGVLVKRFIGVVQAAEIEPYLANKKPYPLYGKLDGQHKLLLCGIPDHEKTEAALPIMKELEAFFQVEYSIDNEYKKLNVDLPFVLVYKNDKVATCVYGDITKQDILDAVKEVKTLSQQKQGITVVVCGFNERAFTLNVVARVLKKDGITVIHTTDYEKYGVTETPTIIVYEGGEEVFRFVSTRARKCT